MPMYIYIYIHTYTRICINIYIYICIYTYMYIYKFYINIYSHMYLHVCAHIFTHTHTHTRFHSLCGHCTFHMAMTPLHSADVDSSHFAPGSAAVSRKHHEGKGDRCEPVQRLEFKRREPWELCPICVVRVLCTSVNVALWPETVISYDCEKGSFDCSKFWQEAASYRHVLYAWQ